MKEAVIVSTARTPIGKAEYFREANKAPGALVAAPPEIDILDTVQR